MQSTNELKPFSETETAKNTIYITHLYPDKMCIYGDLGNIKTLVYRAKKYGFKPVVQPVFIGDALPNQTDIYFMGGGQDNDQFDVYQDLLQKKEILSKDVEDGVALLAICGGYQLLGQTFLDAQNREMEGLDIFPVKTQAPDETVKSRCIGNLIIGANIPELEEVFLVGFENHGGQTFIIQDHPHTKNGYYLGKVLYGNGNNLSGEYEGYVYKNAVGTYLHGSCLPKNPELANWLLQRAVERKDAKNNTNYLVSTKWSSIDDSLALAAKEALVERFLS